jgi:hypothetical protein
MRTIPAPHTTMKRSARITAVSTIARPRGVSGSGCIPMNPIPCPFLLGPDCNAFEARQPTLAVGELFSLPALVS